MFKKKLEDIEEQILAKQQLGHIARTLPIKTDFKDILAEQGIDFLGGNYGR